MENLAVNFPEVLRMIFFQIDCIDDFSSMLLSSKYFRGCLHSQTDIPFFKEKFTIIKTTFYKNGYPKAMGKMVGKRREGRWLFFGTPNYDFPLNLESSTNFMNPRSTKLSDNIPMESVPFENGKIHGWVNIYDYYCPFSLPSRKYEFWHGAVVGLWIDCLRHRLFYKTICKLFLNIIFQK